MLPPRPLQAFVMRGMSYREIYHMTLGVGLVYRVSIEYGFTCFELVSVYAIDRFTQEIRGLHHWEIKSFDFSLHTHYYHSFNNDNALLGFPFSIWWDLGM